METIIGPIGPRPLWGTPSVQATGPDIYLCFVADGNWVDNKPVGDTWCWLWAQEHLEENHMPSIPIQQNLSTATPQKGSSNNGPINNNNKKKINSSSVNFWIQIAFNDNKIQPEAGTNSG